MEIFDYNFVVRPAWAVAWWWKSTTSLAVGTLNWTIRMPIVRWNLRHK